MEFSFIFDKLMMIKKFLEAILFIMIFCVWVSFANTLHEGSHFCVMFENVEIDNYRVIVETDDSITDDWWIYVPNQEECVRNVFDDIWWITKVNVLLLDKDIDVNDITREIVDSNSIFLWDVLIDECYSTFDCTSTAVYEIRRKENIYQLVLNKDEELLKYWKQFPKAWLFAVLMETFILFFIAKLFWRKCEIDNKKLVIFWIFPTSITLPLLWYVFSLLENYLTDVWFLYFIVIWELLVSFVEAVIIKFWLVISWKKSIVSSIICNFFSFVLWMFLWILSSLN